MTNGLFYAHSGLRYLVLLVAVVAIVNGALALRSERPATSTDRILMAAYTGLLDLQFLLGVGLIVSGILYPALIGHIVTMLLALAVAHVSAVLARKAPDARRGHAMRLAGVLGSLVLILGGIMAIGRSVLGSGTPSL